MTSTTLKLQYWKAYPQEIEAARRESHRTPEELKQIIPNLHVFEPSADPA